MAYSKCGSCGSGSFEIQAVEPRGSKFKHYFVQCASCGVPVGVLDFFNIGSMAQDIKEMLGELSTRLKRVESALQR